MTSTCQFWWNWAIQALIAFGTIGAVVAALFGNWIRARFWPPELSINLQDSSDLRVPMILTSANGTQELTDSRWYHVRVENARRSSPATGVRVLILRLEEPDSAGFFQVKWAGEAPLNWSHQGFKPLTPTIGSPDEVDLCSVRRNPSNPGGPHVLELHPLFRSFSLNTQWSSPCKLAVLVQARSVEVDSNTLRVEISWDGQWSDDATQMRHHLVAKTAPA